MSPDRLLRNVEKVALVLPQIMKRLRPPPEPKRTRPDLTYTQFRTLRILSHHGNCRMSDMAEMAGVTLSTATAAVDRLIREGLAERTTDPEDRRIVRVRLSGKGRQATESHRRRHREHMAGMFELLDDAEQERLVKSFEAIEQLLTHVSEKLGNGRRKNTEPISR